MKVAKCTFVCVTLDTATGGYILYFFLVLHGPKWVVKLLEDRAKVSYIVFCCDFDAKIMRISQVERFRTKKRIEKFPWISFMFFLVLFRLDFGFFGLFS